MGLSDSGKQTTVFMRHEEIIHSKKPSRFMIFFHRKHLKYSALKILYPHHKKPRFLNQFLVFPTFFQCNR